MLDARDRLPGAALGFVNLAPRPYYPALDALHQYLDSWRGAGAVAARMARPDFELQLTKYAERGWRENFYSSGLAHSVASGTGWATTPWRVVQRAAWAALARA